MIVHKNGIHMTLAAPVHETKVRATAPPPEQRRLGAATGLAASKSDAECPRAQRVGFVKGAAQLRIVYALQGE